MITLIYSKFKDFCIFCVRILFSKSFTTYNFILLKLIIKSFLYTIFTCFSYILILLCSSSFLFGFNIMPYDLLVLMIEIKPVLTNIHPSLGRLPHHEYIQHMLHIYNSKMDYKFNENISIYNVLKSTNTKGEPDIVYLNTYIFTLCMRITYTIRKRSR